MITIFLLSAQEADASQALSDSTLELIMDSVGQHMAEIVASFVVEYIRKIAHFLIYMLLGMFTYLTAREWWDVYLTKEIISKYEYDKNEIKKFKVYSGWGIAILYAISDEIHQKFVAGRSSEWRDICIDTLGAFVGIIIVGLVILLKDVRKNKRKKHE